MKKSVIKIKDCPKIERLGKQQQNQLKGGSAPIIIEDDVVG